MRVFKFTPGNAGAVNVKYVSMSRDCTVDAVRHDRRSLNETGERKPGSESLPCPIGGLSPL